MSIIFYLSSRQGTVLAPTYFWNYLANKGAHMFWYGILSLSYFVATKRIGLSILLTTLYGVSDELHQSFVLTRTGRVSDVIVDFTAACFMMIAVYIFYRVSKKRPRF